MAGLTEQYALGAVLSVFDQGASSQMNKFGSATSGAWMKVKQLTGTLGQIGRSFSTLSIALQPLGNMFRKSFDAYIDYEKDMARVSTLLDKGQDAMTMYGREVEGLAMKYGVSLKKMGPGLFQTISANIADTREEQEKFLDVATRASVGGFTDLFTSVDVLSSLYTTYGTKIEDVEKISDILFTTNKLGKTTFGEMAATMGRVAPMAKQLGVSLEEMSAVIATVTQTGLKTDEVMTSLRAILSSVIKPTSEAEKQAKKLGITLGTEGIKAAGGFQKWLQIVLEKTKGNNAAIVDMFGNVRALNTMMFLASDEGGKKYLDFLGEIQSTTGMTQKAFEDVDKTLGAQLERLKVIGEVSMVKMIGGLLKGLGGADMSKTLDKMEKWPEKIGAIFEGVGKAIRRFWDDKIFPLIRKVEDAWGSLDDKTKMWIGNISAGAIIASGALVSLLPAIMSLHMGFSALRMAVMGVYTLISLLGGPVTAAAVGIVAIGIGISLLSDYIDEDSPLGKIVEFFDRLATTAGLVWRGFKAGWKTVEPYIKGMLMSALEDINRMLGRISNMLGLGSTKWRDFGEIAGLVVGGIAWAISGAVKIVTWFLDQLTWFVNSIIQIIDKVVSAGKWVTDMLGLTTKQAEVPSGRKDFWGTDSKFAEQKKKDVKYEKGEIVGDIVAVVPQFVAETMKQQQEHFTRKDDRLIEAVSSQKTSVKITNENKLDACGRSLGKSQSEHEITLAKRGMTKLKKMSGQQAAVVLEHGTTQWSAIKPSYFPKGTFAIRPEERAV